MARKAQNLLDAIEKSKERDLASFLFALGIPNTGKSTTKMLADHYRDLNRVMAATAEELVEPPDVGGIVAESIAGYFADPFAQASIQKMLSLGVQAKAPEAPKPVSTDSYFSGKTVVLTGTLHLLTREEATERLKRSAPKSPAACPRKPTSSLRARKPAQAGESPATRHRHPGG